ncbi:MAG: hypothetical protein DMF80_09785 [Acidobacteria bacterium]|nr:MAG: hypothetical protein DMF80_09785 [Acidobacteriota bacterium]
MMGSGVGRSDMAMLLRILGGARSEDLILLPVAGCPHRLSVPTHDLLAEIRLQLQERFLGAP